MSFKLLFILPDKHNKNILAIKKCKDYFLPSFDKSVGDNVEFDDSPQLYNDFFQKITGVSVFRRYSFNTQHYVVFVFDQNSRKDITPENGCEWVAYDKFIAGCQDDELCKIVRSVSNNYNKSVNMPWVNNDGYMPYFNWLYGICAQKSININGKIEQIKCAFVSAIFCVPTDTGNLYMKIPGKVYVTELPFLLELKKLNIAELPVWIDYNLEMNVCLMKDMGGTELAWEFNADTFRKVLIEYSKVQKQSIPHIPLGCIYNDFRIRTIIDKLNELPEKIFHFLAGTKYKLTEEDIKKFEQNMKSMGNMLKTISDTRIPDTVRCGDFRPGNIREAGGQYIFYDWSWGSISNPFAEISIFLHMVITVVGGNLPANVSAKDSLVDAYLREWLEYGTYEELKNVFTVLDDLKELIHWVLDDCFWLEAIHSAIDDNIDSMSADGWLLEKAELSLSNNIKKFTE